MRTLPLAEVIIPADRQRKDLDPEQMAADRTSIKEVGLLNAIVLKADGRTLVAGERRCRMVSQIYAFGGSIRYDGEEVPAGHIPYTTINCDSTDPEVIELAVALAEYDENARRKPLSWQEDSDALAKLHALRTRQKALSSPETPHTVLDTVREVLNDRSTPAGELGGPAQSIREKLILSQHMDDPEVAKAKTAKEAFKILVRKEDNARFAAQAAVVGATFSVEQHHIIQGDCLDIMARWELSGEPKFDCILTDPLYGMDADQFNDGAGKLTAIEHNYDDSYENWQRIMPEFARLSYAVTKEQAHAYVFCAFERFEELKHYMERNGWYVFKTPLIYHKTDGGRVPLPNEGPRRCYEICLYAIKNHKPTTGIYPDVFAATADEQMGHGAQKPVAAFAELLRRTCRAGDRVLDAFAGSGSILPAAHELRVEAWLIELSQVSYGKCLSRAELLKQQGELPLSE